MKKLLHRLPGNVGLLLLVGLGYIALFAFFGGLGLAIQSKVAQVDPGGKNLALGLVAGASALCSTIANPVGGALSDRTASRLGRRVPWLLGGSAAALGFGLVLPSAESVAAIAIVACLAFAAVNLYQAALAAVIPDEIPRSSRGRASAAVGVASALGWIIGTQLVARWPEGPAALGILGAGLVSAAIIAALFARPLHVREVALPPVDGTATGNGLTGYLTPFRSRDFSFVFAGRALMLFSYYLVLVYLLYLLQDYVSRPDGLSATRCVATVATVSGSCAMAAAVAGGFLADRLGRYKVFVLVAGAVGAVALLIPIFSKSWAAFLVFAAIQGFAVGVYYGVDTAIATLALPDDRTRGRDLGVLNVAASAPPVAAPFVAAFVVESAGYVALFPVAAFGALLATVSIVGVRGVP